MRVALALLLSWTASAAAFLPFAPAGVVRRGAGSQSHRGVAFRHACLSRLSSRKAFRAADRGVLAARMDSSDSARPAEEASPPLPPLPGLPSVEIEYCTGCRWMLRSAWLAQELLTTFDGEIARVSIMPSRARGGGIFDVRVNGQLVWDRKEMGRFPEAKELKQRIRDVIAPDKDLGHSDRSIEADFREEFAPTAARGDEGKAGGGAAQIEMMDDDSAEQARRIFGVM